MFGLDGNKYQKPAGDSPFIEKINTAFKPSDAELVIKAYTYTKERINTSGASVFKVAELLLSQGADAVTISATLLAPLLWHGYAEPIEINSIFDQTVSSILSEFKSTTALRTDTELHRRKDIHTFLSSFAGDTRKIILRLAFRLIELESALESRIEGFRDVAQETMDLYVPIASHLSLGELRKRLEDVCFHILDTAVYESLKRSVTPIQTDDEKCLGILMKGVKRLLEKNSIRADIQGRTKSLFGIHCKMMQTGKNLEEIMDRIGLRIIVASVPECYSVLGLLHTHFKPIPGTFDDYIGLPKVNGYQSLHTCVYPVREISHKPIEFQVRTELMHMEAEHGTAAHWRYKNKAVVMEREYQKTQWIEGLTRQHEKANSNKAFIDLLHRQVFRDRLVVFGNGGRIVRLSDKATIHDYLDITNTHVPKGAVVKVNGKTADMNHPLRDGDSIEIVQNKRPSDYKPDTYHKDGSNTCNVQ